MIDSLQPVVIVVSRLDVEALVIEPYLRTLARFIEPDTMRSYQGRVDIWFHGYDQDGRELFQIPEVRKFVAQLDEVFPYWLYFLTLEGTGLMAIGSCLFPDCPDIMTLLKDGPGHLADLIERRWAGALFDIARIGGESEEATGRIGLDAVKYFNEGPRTPFGSPFDPDNPPPVM